MIVENFIDCIGNHSVFITNNKKVKYFEGKAIDCPDKFKKLKVLSYVSNKISDVILVK